MPAHPMSGRSLSSNAIWSLTGEALPFLFALPAIPLLIVLIGTERFGLLSIIWVIIGYFNLFDLGLGRAVTQFAAARIGAGDPDAVPRILWSALALMLPIALLLSLGALLAADMLAAQIPANTISPDEVATAIRLLGIGIPFVMATTMLKGLLQAGHDFRTLSYIQLPLGLSVFFGPVVMALFGLTGLPWLTVSLLVARIGFCGWYALAAARLFPGIRRPEVSLAQLVSMLRFSGWIAFSNLISPILTYCDRLVIGASMGAVAVAHYATPYDTITRTSILAVAVAAVIFPAAAHSASGDPARTARMMRRVSLILGGAVLPLYLLLSAWSYDLLTLWINPDFADAGWLAASLLCAGMFANSLARIPHAILQGRGRADLTALAHLVELPCYILVLVILLPRFGLAGVAAAWSLRAFMDYALLSLFAARILHQPALREMRILLPVAGLCLLIAWAGAWPLAAKAAGLVIALGAGLVILRQSGLPGMLKGARIR